ncbi:MAG: adenylate cyclase [Verrucomicrobiota bacterium]
MNPRNFFSELKRRNVYKVAVAYAVVSWLVIQISSTILPTFHTPEWVLQTLVVIVALGFPIALVLAWAFEITPEGLMRVDEVDPDKSITRRTGRKLVIFIVLAAVSAAGLLLFQLSRNKQAQASGLSVALPAEKSIAVLPFVNMSAGTGSADFSDGITEEILNALAQIPDLKVAARTSAFQFKGQNVDLRRVGETLGVAYVLEGSVQRVGDDVRITSQLIDARTGYHLWSEKYDRKLTSIFAIEDEISKAIAAHMKVTLNNGGEKPLVKTATANPEAHELYLKGVARITERGAALNNAVQFFKQAITLDPNYAAAWAGLGQACELLPWYKLAPWQISLAQAQEAAERALTLDAHLAEAHTALANVLRDRLDFANATREYLTALENNPGSAETLNQYAQMLLRMGRLEDAVKQEQAAVALDPLAPNPRYMLGMMLGDLHRYNEAIAAEQIVIARNPNYTYAHFHLTYLYIYTSNYLEAEKEARAAAAQVSENPKIIAALVGAVARPSERLTALKLVTEGKIGRYSLDKVTDAFWCGMLGANEEALERLKRWRESTEQGELFSESQALWAPVFDPMRADPRYQAIMQSLGLPNAPVPLEGSR